VFFSEFIGIGEPYLKKGHFKNVQNEKSIAKPGKKINDDFDTFIF
jgi:hypothetical protein